MMTIGGLIATVGQVERGRLICTWRVDMAFNDEALPVVLSLLDQLYDTRRRMHELIDRLREIAPQARGD